MTSSVQTPSSSSKANPSPDKRFRALDLTLKRNQYSQKALIEVLHKAQETFGYLEEDVLIYIARQLKLPLSRVYGVATFYHLFSLKPGGEHTCVVCMGTACYVKGAAALLEKLDRELHLHPGETSEDGKVSLLTARCIGACGIAPAAVYDGKVAAQQSADDVFNKVNSWRTT